MDLLTADAISMPDALPDLLIRLTLAAVLGGAIGLNREWEQKPAGLRTHALVGLGSALFLVPAIFGVGVLLGLDTLVAQAFGARRLPDCHRWLYQGVHLALLLTAPLAASVLVGIVPALAGWGINPRVLELAVPYLRTLTWSLPPLLLYTAFRRYLQAMHHVHAIAIALATANLINLLGNWALVYGHLGAPAMGVQGSAWATVVSRIYMALYLLAAILIGERRRPSGLFQAPAWPESTWLWHLFTLGLPAALQLSLDSAEPAGNDPLRGEGTHAAVLEAIGRLRDRGIRVRIATTVEDQTPEELDRLCELHRALGISDEDHVVRRIVRRGKADLEGLGVPLGAHDVLPELTLTSEGAFLHPFGPTVRGGVTDLDGVRRCVIDAVQKAQGFGCSPGTIGVGIGGDRITSYIESKEQLFRDLVDENPNATLAALDEDDGDQGNRDQNLYDGKNQQH